MNNNAYCKKKKQILAVMWAATVCFVTGGILYVAFVEASYRDIYDAAPVAQSGENVHG